MRRISLYMLAAMLLASCSEANIEEYSPIPERDRIPETIYVSLDDETSRVQLNAEGKTVWTEGDFLTAFYQTDGNSKFKFRGKTGDRSGGFTVAEMNEGTTEIEEVILLYPYSADYKLNTKKKTVKVNIPAEQHYLGGSYGVGTNLMASVETGSDFSLKSLCGWISIQLKGAGSVTSVTLTGNNGEQLAGDATFHYDEMNLELLYYPSAPGDDSEVGGSLIFGDFQETTTLICDEPVELHYTEPTEFYFVVPPQTFSQGITIEATCSDGTVLTKSTSKALTIERNHIVPMSPLTINAPTANQKLLYTTTDGNPLSFSEGYTMGEATLEAHTYIDGVGEMIFDKEITTIAGYMFYGSETLETITLPSTLKEIEMLAFWRCSNLQNVTLPEGLEILGMGAFTGCESITSVTIPESVISVGDNEFRNCASLAEFKGKYASEDGRCLIVDGVLNSFAPADLTTYAIPEGVVRVGEDSFNGCANLTSVTIPEGVEELGNWVFWQCTALTSLEIPASVTQIGQQCFGGCTLLSEFYCNPTTPPALELFSDSWSAFENIAEGAKIYVPAESVEDYKAADGWSDYADMIVANPRAICYTSTDGEIVEPYRATVFGTNIVSNTYKNGKGVITFDGPVTEIGDYAFYGCKTLTDVTIPNGVTEIGSHAFYYCDSLESIPFLMVLLRLEGKHSTVAVVWQV